MISKFDEFKKELTLEEYGASLVVNKNSEKINCKNGSWEILDTNDILVKSIAIPQSNGIDTVDRIEFMRSNLTLINGA